MLKNQQPATPWRLPDAVLASMRGSLTAVGDETLSAVLAEVPAFGELSREPVGPRIERAVRRTLRGFVDVIADDVDLDDSTRLEGILNHAYDVGRGEAQGGRSNDALLAAYRVGARSAWRMWSADALARGLPGVELAVFAEVIFDYMDRVSAAGVAGHSDEQAKSGLARQRQREQLTRLLLDGCSERDLRDAAERADWTPPRTLTAIAVPPGRVAGITAVDSRAIEVPDDYLASARRPLTVVLMPDISASSRAAFVTSIGFDGCVVGPSRPWLDAAQSLRRVTRALDLDIEFVGILDTDDRLAELVLSADPDALADLRARALSPLDDLTPTARDKLAETLRAWLLHHGRRDDIATELFVHPSTVRYRLGQLRELYGDKMTDPRTVLELTIALG